MMKKSDPVSFRAVDINGGFWQKKQKINSDVTIYAVRNRFKDTGRFDAYRLDWREGMPNKPYLVLNGDIEKWIESVAYILEKNGKNPELEAEVDEIVDLIDLNQDINGYFNIMISALDPSHKWVDRGNHELYSAGHMIEAAVAYYNATGKDKLLKCACRFADYIYRVFVEEQSAFFVTPGHEEIELALVKLYHCTGEKRYLELSKFFVDQRGNNAKEDNSDFCGIPWAHGGFIQAHLPVREQKTAEGHAVRAGYLYAAMADMAKEYDDEALFSACRAIFDNIVTRRMYITGGIGSTARCEGFTIDYDLPNLLSYNETCAGIALMMFASRMQQIDTNSVYADTIERVLFNAFMSSVSLDGKCFFYENPLEIDPPLITRDLGFAKISTKMPPAERVEVFHCSCCPPNLTRFTASLGDLIYTTRGDTLFVHQYMENRAEIKVGDATIVSELKTDYPVSGKVLLKITGAAGKKVALRIPYWCDSFSLSLDGKAITAAPVSGYVSIPIPSDTANIEADFAMEIFAVEATPQVHEDAGRIAVQRGPVLYCLEEHDNGAHLRDLHILPETIRQGALDKEIGTYELLADGWRRDVSSFDSLYRKVRPSKVDQKLRLIPYYAFANRGASEMLVWILS